MSRISSWVSRSPSTSACEEVAEQVVALLAAARSSMHLLEVRVDRVGRLLLVRLGLGVAELVADDLVGPDDAVLHREEARQVVHRQAEHA